jgi:carboxypeptidase C (cathepsin A)
MTTHALTLVGESYAGTYIPSVARGIYLNNKSLLPHHDGTPRFIVPLYGIAIGNGKHIMLVAYFRVFLFLLQINYCEYITHLLGKNKNHR